MSIIDQLINVYHNHEYWHEKKLSIEDSKEYFLKMLSRGNIIVYMDGDDLAGYVEFYRITPQQWRKILNKKFFAFDENTTAGNICYINSLFIYDKYRYGYAFNFLKHLFFNMNKKCKYFVGIDNRHKKRIRVREINKV